MPAIMNHPVKLELREHGHPWVSCTIGDFRYHIWLVSIENGVPEVSKDRIVYKNPVNPLPGARSKTIKLHRDYGSGKPIFEHMINEVPKLFEEAKVALADKIAMEAIEHRRKVLQARKIKAAEALFDALKAFIDNKDINAAVVEATELIADIERT